MENTPAAWTARAKRETSHDAAGWSEHGQTQRFLAVLRHLDLRDADTLLDYGAGTGRLCEFLPREVDYFAHDTAPGMLARVERDHPHASILPELPARLFDHVVAVGPFNLPGDDAFQKLAVLWTDHARRTLVASLYRGDDPRCVGYDPAEVCGWARMLGATRFLVDCSFLDNDVLLVMHR